MYEFKASQTFNRISMLTFRMFLVNFLSGATDAFLADLADVLISGFVGFAFFITLFRKLHHNIFTIPAIFSIELHYCVSSGGRA